MSPISIAPAQLSTFAYSVVPSDLAPTNTGLSSDIQDLLNLLLFKRREVKPVSKSSYEQRVDEVETVHLVLDTFSCESLSQ